MSIDAPFTPAKRKISVFWWIGAVALLLVILFFVQLLGPSPKIVVSKQTTYVTEPLLPSGLPNYEEHLRQKLRDGITPENNAAVLLAQAQWSNELKDEQAELVAAELGLKQIPSTDTVMQPMYSEAMRQRVSAWLKPQYLRPDGAGIAPDADDVIALTSSYPWTRQQLPAMAEWVDANQKPLDLIVEASGRPRYYWPVPELLNDKPDSLAAALPDIVTMRNSARGLTARAMRSIGENRLPEAWQDILAVYRLSDLMTQNSLLVGQLVGMAIRGMANHATQALLSSPHLTETLAHQVREELAALPAFSTMADSMNFAERLFVLDSVIHAKTNGFNQIAGGLEDEIGTSPFDYAAVDWNIVLTKSNATFDDLVTAMRHPDAESRARALDDFETQLNAEQQHTRSPASWAAALFSRGARSELIGKLVVSLLLPAMQAANTADDRARAVFAMTQLAAALAEYRAEHGKYPAQLDDLTPGILATVPADMYHAKPYVYRRIDDGYLLYTAGSNGNDDGGSNEIQNIFEGQELEEMELSDTDAEGAQIPAGADDFSIRMPKPDFKLPQPTSQQSPIK